MTFEPKRFHRPAPLHQSNSTGLLLVLTLTLAVAACGSSSDPSDESQTFKTTLTDQSAPTVKMPTNETSTNEMPTPDGPVDTEKASGDDGLGGNDAGAESSDLAGANGHEPATQAAILFPIADGELLNWQTALADLIGPNYDQYEASRARFGLTQQTTVSQETPMGNFALIYMEGADLGETSKQMATSPDAWDIDWRQMTSGLHGEDFNDEQALSFTSKLVLNTGDLDDEAKKSTTPFLFFMPLAQPSAGALITELESLSPEKLEEHRNARANIGVLEEKIFLQDTAVGPGLVIYWESLDPATSLDQLLSSEESYDVWIQENFGSYHTRRYGAIALYLRASVESG